VTGADNQQICAVLLGAAVQPHGHRGPADMRELCFTTGCRLFALQHLLGLFPGRGIKFMDDDSGGFQVDVDQGEPSLGSQKTLGQRDGIAAAASAVDSDDHVLEHGDSFPLDLS
jgi:hypothetical protein